MNIQPASVMIGGRPHRGVICTCKCGVLKSVATNDVKGAPSDQGALVDKLVARKLEDAGWKVLKRKDGHSCPGCVAKADTSAHVIVKDFKDMKPNSAPPSTATFPTRASEEAPAELTRENRRIILAKLEDVYVDERTGYAPGWTDAKVASDLGVPRAWVKTLRADNFGPEGNEDIKAALAEAKRMQDETRVRIEVAEKILVELKEANRRFEKVERTIIEIEKGLRA
jgi:hypothetical protein